MPIDVLLPRALVNSARIGRLRACLTGPGRRLACKRSAGPVRPGWRFAFRRSEAGAGRGGAIRAGPFVSSSAARLSLGSIRRSRHDVGGFGPGQGCYACLQWPSELPLRRIEWRPCPMIESLCETAVEPAPDAASAPGPWYLCLTKPRQEIQATQHLEEQGYAVFLPQMSVWTRKRGGWCRKSTIMFPRYVFVRPSRAGQAIGAVRSTPGVTTLVRFGPVLACLRADRLDALRALVATHSAMLPDQPFQAGSAVIFNAGPLKGAAGIVSGVAAERVQVMMSLLGQDQTVLVSVHDLVCA